MRSFTVVSSNPSSKYVTIPLISDFTAAKVLSNELSLDNWARAISSYISSTLLSRLFLKSYTSEKLDSEKPALNMVI